MNETVLLVLTKVLSATAAGLMLFSLLYIILPVAVREAGMIIRKALQQGFPTILLASVFVSGMILHGGSKYNTTNNPPRQAETQLPRNGGGNLKTGDEGVSTSNRPDILHREPMYQAPLSNNLARIEKWFLRGAWNDGQIIHFDNDWSFPYSGTHLSSIEIWSQGVIYPSEKSSVPIASLVTPLSLKPLETEVFCGRTAYDSYRIEWRNAHPDRDMARLASASIELRRNGTCIVTENETARVIPYDIPFFHNGFGQDDDWVRANFSNANEILYVGYRSWAESQIGYDQLNGLYLFTVTFPKDPTEATELFVGDYTVAVTNAGEYVFVLKKGTEYEFGTWPHDADVEYYAQDDMGEDAPLLTALWEDWYSYGTWTIGGGWNWLYYPDMHLSKYYPGTCCWMPTLQGSPDVSHIYPEDLPMSFNAVLSDYCGSGTVTYCWSSPDGNIHYSSPNSSTTQVTVNSIPSWSENSISVEATLSGYTLFSYLDIIIGYLNERPVSWDISSLELLSGNGSTINWTEPVLVGNDIKVKVSLRQPCDSPRVFASKYNNAISLRSYSVDENGNHDIANSTLPLSMFSVTRGDSYHYFIHVPAQWLQQELLISNSEDGIIEKTTLDMSSATTGLSQRTDSDAVDECGGVPGILRGRVREEGNESATIPEGPLNLTYLRAAGTALLVAEAESTLSSPRPVQQQADLLYYSGHGSHATGRLLFGSGSSMSPSDIGDYWVDVDTIIIAGCAVLDIKDFRASSFSFRTKLKWHYKGGATNPGIKWESLGLDLYLGYAWLAPRDSEGGNAIAARFKANMSAGQDPVIAWKNANDCPEGRNACAIDCRTTPHTFWYWDERGSTPTWTSTTKGKTSW